MRLNITTGLIVLGVIVLTLRFQKEIGGLLGKLPLIGTLAGIPKA